MREKHLTVEAALRASNRRKVAESFRRTPGRLLRRMLASVALHRGGLAVCGASI